MKLKSPLRLAHAAALVLAALTTAAPAHASATVTIVNANAAGVGFNDSTPATPVGGNPGTTIGQQRLNAFQFAASIWAETLDSNVEILVQSTFEPLTCTATSAVLGSAGTIQIVRDFAGDPGLPGAEFPQTWYPTALANRRAGHDLIPGAPGTNADDIRARFNSNLGAANCLTGVGWYYGFDLNHGTNIDLVTVLLHEFAHGFGFQTFVTLTTGAQPQNFADIFERRILDNSLGLHWHQMTNAQRVTSAINTRHVAWDGPLVTEAVPATLDRGVPFVVVSAPAAIAGRYDIGPASFGPPLSSAGVTGTVVQALDPADAAGPSTFDACSPLSNAAAVSGRIALVDRGTCGFTIKVKNAQNAGAIAVLVVDNVAGSPPPGLGGADPTITIPSGRISQADGNLLKSQLAAGVTATILIDLSVFVGADPSGRALLWTPNPLVVGSSVPHWDVEATPNLLMEPNINTDLPHSLDLTVRQLADIGWFPFGRVNRKIAFAAFGDSPGIYVVEPDGSGQTLLGDGGDVVWSPNGQRMALVRVVGAQPPVSAGAAGIWLQNADGSGRRQLTAGPADFSPAWSPDGKKIAFIRDTSGYYGAFDIFSINVDGTGLTQLTAGPDDYTYNFHPSWSPDSSKLVFYSDRTHDSTAVYVMNADGSGQTRLTFGPRNDWEPEWSPDGASILFTSDRDTPQRGQIWVMDANGANARKIVSTGSFDGMARWSPDGARITFSRDNAIYVMNRDGSAATRVAVPLGLRPAWQGLP